MLGVGVVFLILIYFIRALVLFVFNGTFKLDKITPEVFLAPRGLITILLFYSVPSGILPEGQLDFVKGILLFGILFS